MGKKLLQLVWDLPASFSLPSPAECRRALTRIQLGAVLTERAREPERRRHPRCFSA